MRHRPIKLKCKFHSIVTVITTTGARLLLCCLVLKIAYYVKHRVVVYLHISHCVYKVEYFISLYSHL